MLGGLIPSILTEFHSSQGLLWSITVSSWGNQNVEAWHFRASLMELMRRKGGIHTQPGRI